MNATDELSDLAEARSKSWWLLSRFFLERPEPSFLADLRASFAAAATPGDEADEDLWSLRDCLAEDTESLSARLLPEYTRLLRGIKEHYGPPPPFECVQRGGQPMGEATQAVVRHYAAAGFAGIAPEAGPQDHLGVEIRFLSLLCFREMEAWASGDAEAAMVRIAHQRTFLDAHLLAWLPDYTRLIAAESRGPFYAAAVRLTLTRAMEERGLLDDLEAGLEAA